MIIDKINFIKELEKYRDDKIIILGHEHVDVDSIVSGFLLEKHLIRKGFNVKFCIPDKTINQESFDICMKYGLNPSIYKFNLDDSKDVKYILVDHHIRNLKGQIIAIIDHHPTNKKINTKLYFNKLISSTACYIVMNNEKYFSKEELKLALLATFLDTASFHSNKTREVDKEWVLKYCDLLNIDYNDLYKTGIYLTPLNDINEVYLNGLKRYVYGDKKVESSYVQIENNETNDIKIELIINKIKCYVKINNLYLFVFIVHDMSNFRTKVYKIANDFIKEKGYDSYTSRGNTIMPEIEKEILN